MPDPHLAAGHTGCTTYNVCSAAQWETAAKTLTSDRECTEHTTCLAGLEWAHLTAGTHHDRECSPLTVCTATEWESVAPGPANNRECTSRGSCIVTVDDIPAYYPSHVVDGDPMSTAERVSMRDVTTDEHFSSIGGGESLTDLFDNIHFTTDSINPVQNEKCAGGWCMSNGGDVAAGQCVDDGDWGWSFYRPVKRMAISTPNLANFKSASVWIYDEAGVVLEKRTIGARHEGNQFLAFTSTCGIAKARLQVHNYVAGSKFCLRKIWYDGEKPAKSCTLTTCRQETHTCEHWRTNALGIVAPHHAAAGECSPAPPRGGTCSANGNCDGVTAHSSIRVYHRLHDTQLDPHSGWLLKDEASKLEKNCYTHHRCGMGVVTGDATKCECKQM
jgi:hypothetical protein